jgi:rhodanese-related sulfurtransferase
MPSGNEIAQAALDREEAISCKQLHDMLERDEGGFVLLDVRTEHEWEAGHIPDAVHIPRGLLEFKVEEQIPNKDTRVILCCAGGARSALAAARMREMGYTNVAYVADGYEGYCNRFKSTNAC